MLIFHRPEFIRGSIKVKDVKLDEKGEPLYYEGEPVFVYWHLTPDMKGKVIKFNDEDFVKKTYPHMFFKSKDDIENHEMEKRRRAHERNVKKANEKEKQLAEEIKQGLIPESELQDFRKERKRFKR